MQSLCDPVGERNLVVHFEPHAPFDRLIRPGAFRAKPTASEIPSVASETYWVTESRARISLDWWLRTGGALDTAVAPHWARAQGMAEEASEVRIMFNNNRSADAPTAARRFRELVGQDPGPAPEAAQRKLL